MARLIDVNRLLSQAETFTIINENGFEEDINAVTIDDILIAPTVEPQVVRGEWIKIKDGRFGEGKYECSVCKAIEICPYNYCHNCGADMRKESE